MSKVKTSFFCQHCGYESAKWLGKCPSCQEWNGFVEEVLSKGNDGNGKEDWSAFHEHEKSKTILLDNVSSAEEKRMVTADNELNRVLGGGIVPGALILVAGEPGIGKSTLFLQNGLQLKQIKTLYVSGEESEQQIKMRADRLGISNPNFFLITETDTRTIFKEIMKLKPELVIIDSILTLQSPFVESAPGSVSQMVLQFEGDRHYAYRILRTLKNRFGSTSELGIYEMTGQGMRPVDNPSEILIAQKEDHLSGIAIAATMEGMRPLLIETQALVTPSVYGTPQRTVSGFDLRRLQLLLAVLEKRGGFQFGMKDVFVNIAGGIKADDPSIDLAIVSALLSSFEDVALPQKVCFSGEVGLSGEIRAVNRIEQRIAEAEKLGFEKIIVSKYNKIVDKSSTGIQIVALSKVEELYHLLF